MSSNCAEALTLEAPQFNVRLNRESKLRFGGGFVPWAERQQR